MCTARCRSRRGPFSLCYCSRSLARRKPHRLPARVGEHPPEPFEWSEPESSHPPNRNAELHRVDNRGIGEHSRGTHTPLQVKPIIKKERRKDDRLSHVDGKCHPPHGRERE